MNKKDKFTQKLPVQIFIEMINFNVLNWRRINSITN